MKIQEKYWNSKLSIQIIDETTSSLYKLQLLQVLAHLTKLDKYFKAKVFVTDLHIVAENIFAF